MQDWQPGQRYETGDRVTFRGSGYVVQQAHQSQGDWTPDRTPALFGKMEGYGQQQQQAQPHQPPHGGGGDRRRRGSNSSSSGDDDDFDKLSPEQKAKKEKFYETDKFKLGAQITGGVVGVAGLAGLGVWAYNKHSEKEKKEAWMASNVNEEGYYNGARARAQKYSTLGSSQVPAVRWVLVDEGGRLPEGALQVGQEADGSPMYAARAFHDGCASIGKTWTNQERCNIPHREKEVIKKSYEVLVAPRSAVTWKRVPLGEPCAPDFRPVEGGRDDQGNFLFVAKAAHGGGMHVAEVTEGHRDAEIPYGGKVVHVEDYEILALADQGQGY